LRFRSIGAIDNRFADFHSNRHTFITNIERAGVSPRTAQSLARHSDIRLTMGVYTHIGLNDQSSAIELLPALPELTAGQPEKANRNGTAITTKEPSNGRLTTCGNSADSMAVTNPGQLDTLWPTLPEGTKAGILALITTAVKPEEGSVAT
jgi:hypothetical protein